MPTLQNTRAHLNDLYFLTVLLGVQILILYGKQVSIFLFNGGESFSPRLWSVETHILILAASVIFTLLKMKKCEEQVIGFWGGLVGILIVVMISVEVRSIIISAMMLFLFIVSTFVVVIDKYANDQMSEDFWALLFSASFKGIQFSLILFGLGMTLIKFVSEGKGEKVDSFLTTFFSATFSMVGIMYVMMHWALLPCWKQLVRKHKKDVAHIYRGRSAQLRKKSFYRQPSSRNRSV